MVGSSLRILKRATIEIDYVVVSNVLYIIELNVVMMTYVSVLILAIRAMLREKGGVTVECCLVRRNSVVRLWLF